MERVWLKTEFGRSRRRPPEEQNRTDAEQDAAPRYKRPKDNAGAQAFASRLSPFAFACKAGSKEDARAETGRWQTMTHGLANSQNGWTLFLVKTLLTILGQRSGLSNGGCSGKRRKRVC